MKATSEIHFSQGPRNVKPLRMKREQITNANYRQTLDDARKVGLGLSERRLYQMMQAMDAADVTPIPIAPLTAASLGAPAQFLQTFLPGFVAVLTQPRTIDELVGISTVGSWEDEELVMGIMELVGNAEPYGDYQNVPLASYNAGYETRRITRFEKGFGVWRLEEARAAKANIDAAARKRQAASEALEIQRNNVGFYGYNDGEGRTFGMLNDPGLLAAITPTAGVGGTTWALKKALEIMADIRLIMSTLRTQTMGLVDPNKAQITLALPTNVIDYLAVPTEFGWSGLDYMMKNYPNVRVIAVPQFNAAVGGLNVLYAYVDSIEDSLSDDDKRTWIQAVPAKFQVLGVENRAKGYIEDFASALGGVILKRPLAVVRMVGI